MAASFDIVAKLRADTSQFIAGLKSGEVASTKFAASMGGVSNAVAVGAAAAVATAGVMLYKLGSSFHEAYKQIRVGTGATGESLDELKQSFNNVFAQTPASMKDVGATIADLNTKLGLTGAPLENLSLQLLKLSRITGTDLKTNIESVTTVFKNFGVSASDQKSKLDLLYRASQTSGVSVAELSDQMAKGGIVLRQVGFDFDSTAALMGTLAKAGIEIRDVLPAITKALATAGKSGEDASVMFGQTFNAIRDAKTPIEATGIALDVFGARGGPRLAAAIQEGKLSYEDYMKTIQDGTDTISKASGDVSTFGGKLSIVGHQLMIAFQPLATSVFNAMNEAMKKAMPIFTAMTGALSKVTDSFLSLPTPIMLAIPAIAGIVLAIKGFIALQALISGMAMAVIGAFGTMAAAAGGYAAEFLVAMKVSEAAALEAGYFIQSALGPIAIALAAAFVGYTLLSQGARDSAKEQKEFAATLDEQSGAWTENTRKLVENNLAKKGLLDQMNEAGISVDRVRQFVEDQSGSWVKQTKALELAEAAMGNYSTGAESNRNQTKKLTEEISAQGGVRNQLIADLGRTGLLTNDLVDTLYNEADAYDKKKKMLEAVGVATEMSSGKTKEAAEAAYAAKQANDAQAESVKKLHDELRAAADPYFANLKAQREMNDAQAEYNKLSNNGKIINAETQRAYETLIEKAGGYYDSLSALEQGQLTGAASSERLQQYLDTLARLGIDPNSAAAKLLKEELLKSGEAMDLLSQPSGRAAEILKEFRDRGLEPTSEAARGLQEELKRAGYIAIVGLDGKVVTMKLQLDSWKFWSNLNAVQSFFAGLTPEQQAAAAATMAGARALGGPVIAGASYLVGERGPELFTAPQSGYVVPNSALTSTRQDQSTGSGGDVYVTVNGSNLTPGDVGREVLWAMKVRR